jgi:transcriptional regulator with XRE-family HTH domain
MAEAFGDAVNRLRGVRGRMSLRELARRAHVDAGHLSRVERGQRPPTVELAAALDDVLGAGGDLARAAAAATAPDTRPLASECWARADCDALAAALLAEPPTAGNALALSHEWLVSEPPQAFELRAGRRIGAGVVEQVERRVQQLRELDDHIGGGDSRELVTGELDATVGLLREAAYAERVGQRLLAAIGELCQLAGWVTSDAGRHGAAARLYLTGVRASHAGGDAAGAANNLSCLAYQVANVGDVRQAVTMARTAAVGAGSAPATVRALLWERVAWAHAKAGEGNRADRALGAVEDAYAHRVPADAPAWVYWLDETEIQVMAGRCWTELGRPLRAVPALEEATSSYGPDRARESALYLTWLAAAYLLANEVDQAAETATRALRLARQVRSARSAARVAHVDVLLRPHRGTPSVDGFTEYLRAGH